MLHTYILQEMCFYAGVIVFFFFADLFLSLHACEGGQKAGCVSRSSLLCHLWLFHVNVILVHHPFTFTSSVNLRSISVQITNF